MIPDEILNGNKVIQYGPVTVSTGTTVTLERPEPIETWLRRARAITALVHGLAALLFAYIAVASRWMTETTVTHEASKTQHTPWSVTFLFVGVALDFFWISFLLFEDRRQQKLHKVEPCNLTVRFR